MREESYSSGCSSSIASFVAPLSSAARPSDSHSSVDLCWTDGGNWAGLLGRTGGRACWRRDITGARYSTLHLVNGTARRAGGKLGLG
jgi:hypothetical protein